MTNLFFLCIGLKIFMDKIFVINLHLTKITKFIDLENLELYGTQATGRRTVRSTMDVKTQYHKKLCAKQSRDILRFGNFQGTIYFH